MRRRRTFKELQRRLSTITKVFSILIVLYSRQQNCPSVFSTAWDFEHV